MANKDNKVSKKKDAKGKTGDQDNLEKANIVVTIVLVVALVLILLGGFVIFVKLDVGGFGSEVLGPKIKNVPVINKILPEMDDEGDADETQNTYTSISEAEKKIKDLEQQIDKLKKENADINTKVDGLKKENTKLQQYETTQKEFEKLKEKFDEDIVYGEDAQDTSAYAEYYAQMNPDTAERIYKEVAKKQQSDEDVKELANTYAKMDAKNAAKALEEQADNLTLVCDILNQMSQKNRAAIMDEMKSEFAAKVTSKIYSSNKTNN